MRRLLESLPIANNMTNVATGGAKTAGKTQGIAEELENPHSIEEKLAMQRILKQINKNRGEPWRDVQEV